MKTPWTLTGKQLLLSVPEFEWEKIGFMVNEGPAVITRNGKIFITYSGSATDENYAMGLLWADEDSDLLNGFSWHKKQSLFSNHLRKIVNMVLGTILLLQA